MAKRILIIEDEKELADILGTYLQIEGYETYIANDGQKGIETFYQSKPDILLLDIMLPKKDGIEICREVRSSSDIPIIMVSAKAGEMDKVIALGIGADDYVTKPYSPLELVARVKAQLRRYDQSNKKTETVAGGILELGRLQLNKSAYTAVVDNHSINFTTKEFEILCYFAQNRNLVLSKDQIYQAIWGYTEYVDDNSVTVYVNRIREKLGKFSLDYIKTVWGAGYKCTVD